MFSLTNVVTLLSAWFILSVPISLIAGYFLAQQEKRTTMAHMMLRSKR